MAGTLSAHSQNIPVSKTLPTVRQAVRWIAQLGGFLGRKSDGEPVIVPKAMVLQNDLC
jgi:hypothetical protein